MLNCWQQDLKEQKAPQAIMKDMNQVFYRVFNSNKVNAYVTIDDEDYTIKDETSRSQNTTCTTLEQDPVIALSPNKMFASSRTVTPTFSDFSQGGMVVINDDSRHR